MPKEAREDEPMKASTVPQALAVDVVAAQATEADSATVAQLEASENKSLPGVAYIVKVRLKALPEATSRGWALYVDKLRIPKYWTYRQGIYFKVFDPQFFAEHKGGKLRFSQNGTDFVETRLKLAKPPEAKKGSLRRTARLPLQDDVLK
jgi:hypothetical protein